jgi:hypothetical protein
MAVLFYEPEDKDEVIQGLRVLIAPSQGTEDKVSAFIFDSMDEEKGKRIRKNLIWHVDKKFEVIRFISQGNNKESVEKLEVIWNE